MVVVKTALEARVQTIGTVKRIESMMMGRELDDGPHAYRFSWQIGILAGLPLAGLLLFLSTDPNSRGPSLSLFLSNMPSLSVCRAGGGKERLELAPLKPEKYPSYITKQHDWLAMIEILGLVFEPVRKFNVIVKSFQIWVKILMWIWKILKDYAARKKEETAKKDEMINAAGKYVSLVD